MLGLTSTRRSVAPPAVAGHLFEATIIDNATGLSCNWTLIRLAPWLDWRVVAGNQGMLFHFEELEEFCDVVDQMAVGSYCRNRYPNGLSVRLATHEYFE